MIEYIKKDVTTTELGIVAHGVNCQRTMGSGVALAIRKKWPTAYSAYMDNPGGKAMLGTCQLVSIYDDESLWVANCYTQVFYGKNGKFANADAVGRSMSTCLRYADVFGLPVYMPRIGCGLGGLDWDKEVLPQLEAVSEEFNRVLIYVCDLP